MNRRPVLLVGPLLYLGVVETARATLKGHREVLSVDVDQVVAPQDQLPDDP